DGTKLVAAAAYGPLGEPGLIYTSGDSGATWAQTSAPSNFWTSVACSADGTRLVAVNTGDLIDVIDNNFNGQTYISTDSGATWNKSNAPAGNWSCVASSADGGLLIESGYRVGTYISRSTPATMSIATSVGNLIISWLVPSTSFVLQQNFDLGSTKWTDV